MDGAPQSASSAVGGERFGEYLVAKGALRAADLERALACCRFTRASWATRWSGSA